MMITDEQLVEYDPIREIPVQEVNLTKISIEWPDPLLTYSVEEWKKIVDPAIEVSNVLFLSGLIKYLDLN